MEAIAEKVIVLDGEPEDVIRQIASYLPPDAITSSLWTSIRIDGTINYYPDRNCFTVSDKDGNTIFQLSYENGEYELYINDEGVLIKTKVPLYVEADTFGHVALVVRED